MLVTHKLAKKKVRACRQCFCQWGSGHCGQWPQTRRPRWAASGGANFFGVAEGEVSGHDWRTYCAKWPSNPASLKGMPFGKFWASSEVKGTQGLVKGQQLCALGSWLLVRRDAHHQRAL